MDLAHAAGEWRQHGFTVLPGFLPTDVLARATAELDLMFPSAQAFHDGSDPRRARFINDEFAGIDCFPFAGTEVSLLAVHESLIDLAETLLGSQGLRLSAAEAWAKYTGATDYDQDLHRDYLAHTVLAPSDLPAYQQVEMFVYLVDVPEDLGPPHLVSKTRTGEAPAVPNWFLRNGLAGSASDGDGANRFLAPARSPWYEHEVSAAGPAGTVVPFELGTFHRGTGMSRPGGARYTMHLTYRCAEAEWGQRQAWAERSHEPAWYRFIERATPRQLELFGFPPPGHPYWTAATLAGLASRYPTLDLSLWRDAAPSRGVAVDDSLR